MDPVRQAIRDLRHPGKLREAVRLTALEILRARLNLTVIVPSERIRAQLIFRSHFIIHQAELRPLNVVISCFASFSLINCFLRDRS